MKQKLTPKEIIETRGIGMIRTFFLLFILLPLFFFTSDNLAAFWDYYFPKGLISAFVGSLFTTLLLYIHIRSKQRKEAKKLHAEELKR